MANQIPHDPVRKPDPRPDQSPDHGKEKGDQPARNLPDKHPTPPSATLRGAGAARAVRRWSTARGAHAT
ncbi:MAG: hypothetical protein CL858_26935 [Cupriavidus sp.]|nr:hypothetical protein [Cupriavidus sp.]